MVSKIIQKEKERQEEYLKLNKLCLDTCKQGDIISSLEVISAVETCDCHKQSLINLKEYIEFQMNNLVGLYGNFAVFTCQAEEDIKELNKMVEKYDRD